jgi:alpha-amylase
MIGGGYYEPILSTIPDKDAHGQIKLMQKRIKSLFGIEPQGFWIAERAWEPSLPEILSAAGVRYTVVDDTIFNSVGIPTKDCFCPFFVESRGYCVAVFPMLRKLRYLIPFEDPGSSLRFLRKQLHHSTGNIVVYADDGEKFGAWPNTYQLVYQKKWLRSFFTMLEHNLDWIDIVTLDDYLESCCCCCCCLGNGACNVHLPSASYDELEEWSLPAGTSKLGKRGFWRLFLSKYYESQRMYSKMLRVSNIVHKSAKPCNDTLDELWKGQCNDAYWHGFFGGLYLPLLRRSTYFHLLKAQTIAESGIHNDTADWISTSFDYFSGKRELHVDTKSLAICICPWLGGSIGEFSYKALGINFVDTLARRNESYHQELLRMAARKTKKVKSIHGMVPAKEHGLHKLLVYDPYPKTSFEDYLTKPDTNIRNFKALDFTDLALLAGHAYSIEKVEETQDGVTVSLFRETMLVDKKFKLWKNVTVYSKEPLVEVSYKIESDIRLPAKFATEISFGSLEDKVFFKNYSKPKEQSSGTRLKIRYREVDVALEFSRPVNIWMIPIKTVSKSESGFESKMQSLSVIPNFELYLEPRCDVFVVRMSVT